MNRGVVTVASALLIVVCLGGFTGDAQASGAKMPKALAKKEAKRQGQGMIRPGQMVERFNVNCQRRSRTFVACRVFLQTYRTFQTCNEDNSGSLYGFRKQIVFTSVSYLVSPTRYRVGIRNYDDYLEPLECPFPYASAGVPSRPTS